MNNNQKEVAIRISHVSKEYRLGQLGGRTLQHDLQSWWAKKHNRPDPNAKIGQERLNGEQFMALDDINLTIYKGEAIGIIGRNGAGKSTLLKILSQITAPTKGDVEIYGRIASMLEVGTGFHPEMTGRENVYLNGSILGMTREEIDAKMQSIIEFSEIGPFIDTPVKRYSSGMYVKLAFAVSAHLDSEILIMDEVLAVGDVLFRKKSLSKMQDQSDSGKTILYVSHNMATIRQLCDRCAVLHEGKLIYVGDTEKAIQLYLDTILVSDVRRDLSVMKRSARLTNQKMKLLMAEYPHKKNIQFANHEPVRMHMQWENLQDYNDLCLRIEIYTLDDALLASYPLYNIRSGRKGNQEDFYVQLDISNFVQGTYKMKFTFFFQDANETIHDTDRVIGLFFEKLSGPNDPEWDSSRWGYIKLSKAVIVSAKEAKTWKS